MQVAPFQTDTEFSPSVRGKCASTIARACEVDMTPAMPPARRSPSAPLDIIRDLAPSPAAAVADGRMAFAAGGPPRLAVVVDTEEEFDWTKPFTRTSRGVGSIAAQERAHEIYDQFGVRPTYAVDQCVVESDAAVGVLNDLRKSGRAEIGAHLQPWVSEPYLEEVSDRNSFQCNLPPEVERAKLETLTSAIAAQFGARPTVFKAGRYGYGPATTGILLDLGYEIDCSFVPHTNFQRTHGPSFLGVPDQPFWIDAEKRLLETPLSRGFAGALAGSADLLAPFVDAPFWTHSRIGGALARSRLFERITLTPEGVDADAQIRLISAMMKGGARVFTLTYHSPSLEPGHTPYVRDKADLNAFLAAIKKIVTWFAALPDARFTTLEDLRAEARAATV